MKYKIVLMLLVFLFSNKLSAQQSTSDWAKLKYLIGDWKGEGSGKPGEGEGTFSFKLDLDENILTRTSKTEYPATSDKPASIHEDLMIIYKSFNGQPNRAIYFDNEKHVINYSITFSEVGDIVFTSDALPNVPTFRLVYSAVDENKMNIKFEMSRDGEKYFTYVEGKSIRVK